MLQDHFGNNGRLDSATRDYNRWARNETARLAGLPPVAALPRKQVMPAAVAIKPTDQSEFAEGIVYACARLIENFDQPSMAEYILGQSGIDVSRGLEDDLVFIRKIDCFKTLPCGRE